ncbi:MAG: GreA/GreB family elongation factor [Gammaproteobacteria bacterium]|jgi:transcription elongation factor GreB|nr:GreA/GreB family elongation factor [Gammaproteobacteria bacterium]MDP6617249.1 GreA/GreB family elongation factor [Gammaproteobacteria bacterium]MDP6695835.1 GreA/GreB family elongation factor [Gammaproteobacteria bacterium]
MGRWKPPPPKSSPYVTPEGYETLQEELKELWLRRRDVVKALAAAAAEGDRSENAEYIYRKKELGSIDYRIRYLQKRLPKLNVVRETPDAGKVFFGAWVTLENIDDSTSIEYRIVGPDETNAGKGWISIDSPLAKALLKKETDDEVSVMIANQRTDYLVTGIRYAGSD